MEATGAVAAAALAVSEVAGKVNVAPRPAAAASEAGGVSLPPGGDLPPAQPLLGMLLLLGSAILVVVVMLPSAAVEVVSLPRTGGGAGRALFFVQEATVSVLRVPVVAAVVVPVVPAGRGRRCLGARPSSASTTSSASCLVRPKVAQEPHHPAHPNHLEASFSDLPTKL